MGKYEIMRFKTTLVYIAITFFALPLFFWNMYFNISEEKWMCFLVLSLFYVFFILVSYILDNEYAIYFKKLISGLSITEYAFAAFLFFTVVSTIFSVNTFASFTGGVNARYNGCVNIIAYAFVFFVVRKHCYNSRFLMIVFCLTGALVSITAIAQYFTFDPIGMYDKVTAESVRRMISTIGNMNIYASFISLCVSATLYFYIYSERLPQKLFWGICIAIGFMGGLAGNSDSFYLGIGAATLILICSCGLTLRALSSFFSAVCWAGAADYIFLLIRARAVASGLDIRPAMGIALTLVDNMAIPAIIFIVSLIIYLIIKLISQLTGDRLSEKKAPVSAAVVFTILFIGFWIGILGYVFSLYPFDNEIGSYRGFIWNLSISDFKEMSIFRKLFGYGPETIYNIYYSKYHAEMIDVTGVVYDNVHCEPLEYLMTTGILGMLSYLVMIISLLVRLYKKVRRDENTYMFLLPVFAYFIQSFVNIAQSATTPLYFLIIALAGGFLQPDTPKQLKHIDEYTKEALDDLI